MATDSDAILALRAVNNGRRIDESQVGMLLRYVLVHEFSSLRAMARAWGVSAAYLSDAMRGKTPPGPALLDRLGIERAPATYRRREADHV